MKLAYTFLMLLPSLLVGQAVQEKDTVKYDMMILDSSDFSRELAVLMIPNSMVAVVTAFKDTILIGNRSYYSKELPENPLGNCVANINEHGFKVDSIAVGVLIRDAFGNFDGKWYGKFRREGMAWYGDVTIPVNAFESISIREIYRRVYNCGVIVWFSMNKR